MAGVRIAGVLLGMGRSERFGRPKLEATLGGRRVVDIACDHFRAAGFDPVVFVGETVPADSTVLAVRPSPPTNEMIESLRAGLRAIPEGPFAFAPADMPALAPDLLRRLAGLFATGGADYLVPVHGGRRGHPAFARSHEPFFRLGDREGAREVFRAAGASLRLVEVETGDILFDVDRPEDLAAAATEEGRRRRLVERGDLMR